MGGRGGGGPTPAAGEMTRLLREEAGRLRLTAPDDALAGALGELLALLYRWNRRINLTAIRDPRDGVVRHALEALVALPVLPEPGSDELLVCDLGSGNGFPVLPLLLARSDLRGVLFERVARKVDFLRAAVARLGLAGRVEVLETSLSGIDDLPEEARVVTLRAFPRPERWIPEIARDRRACRVLAWLDRSTADEVSSACRHYGAVVSAVELPTRTNGILLCVG